MKFFKMKKILQICWQHYIGPAVVRQCRRKGLVTFNTNSEQGYCTKQSCECKLSTNTKKGKLNLKIGFIGGGNMANAIIEGIVNKGLIPYSQVYVSESNESKVSYWKKKGTNAFKENGRVAEEADIIFLAIKPHILPIAVAESYKTLKNPEKANNKLFISILAGVRLESLENVLAGFKGKRLIRTMPNTPMMLGEGCTSYCPGQTATVEDIKIADQILSSCGICRLIPELLIDAAGALAGSGPAYIFLIIEALSDAGVRMGVPRDMSTQFAAQTVLGAAKMVLETGKHPGTLKDEVCSPGGTTITGIHALERRGVRYYTTEKGKLNLKIGFIGGGNMANALIKGMVQKGLITFSQVYVSAPSASTISFWKEKGANAFNENGSVAEEADIIFLAIKPNMLSIAVADIFKTLKNPSKVNNKLFVSILAGVKLESLENVLAGFEGNRVIRVMPNTPMIIGEGCSSYCPGQTATVEDIKITHLILSSCGICKLIPEAMMDAAGALAGSGPAYICLIIEALSDAGVRMGVPRDMATQFAAQTVLGTSKMVLETGKHPGTLKDEVCSPGGTTITGIHALERRGVRAAMIDAVEAATLKSKELGQKADKNHKNDN